MTKTGDSIFIFKVLTFTLLILAIASFSGNSYAEEGNLSPEKKTETTSETPAESTPTKTEAINRGEIKIAPPIQRFQQQQSDIKHYLKSENVTPLLAQTDEYLTIITPHETEINKGVVILVPDWQKGVTNPSAINYLRKQLPHDGWTTISVHPPAKPEFYPSILIDKQEREKQNQESLKEYIRKMTALMNAVMEKAQNYPGVFVTIAQGSNAAILSHIYSEEETLLPNAFVLLSGYLATNVADKQFALDVARSDFPVLDLTLRKEQQRAMQSAKYRAIKAKHELKAYYRQQEIYNNEFSYYPNKSLRTSLLGWLKSMGW